MPYNMHNKDSRCQHTIDMVNKLGDYGLQIPRLVLIGDRSCGKSSVLEALIRHPFPRSSDIYRRFPTVVNLRCSPGLTEDVLSAHIEGEDEFNDSCKQAVVSPQSFQTVIERAMEILCIKDTDISTKALELTLSGPNQSPLTIVDLPSLASMPNGEQDKTILELNTRYISESCAIILPVVAADKVNCRAFDEAVKHDPCFERTVPIITDQDQFPSAKHNNCTKLIFSDSKKTKIRYLVMWNSCNYNNKLTQKKTLKREKIFQTGMWNAVPADRKGHVAVKDFLRNLLMEHINKRLPQLKREGDAVLESLGRDLEAKGTPIKDPNEALEKLKLATLTLQPKVIGFLNASFSHQYLADVKDKKVEESSLDPYFVCPSLVKLYGEYRSAITGDDHDFLKAENLVQYVDRYKDRGMPGFIPFTVFQSIINGHFLNEWKTVTKMHITKMHEYVSKALLEFISRSANETTREILLRVFDCFSRQQGIKINETIEEIIGDESHPFSINRLYLEVLHSERSKGGQALSLVRDVSAVETPKASDRWLFAWYFREMGLFYFEKSPQPSRSDSRPHPSQSLESSNWGNEHVAQEIHPCLVAYLNIVRPRIVDRILMETIERYMIRKIGDYFLMLFEVKPSEVQCMVDPQTLLREREDIRHKIEALERILQEL